MNEKIIILDGQGTLFDDSELDQVVEDAAFEHGLYDTRAIALFHTYEERLKYAEPFRPYDELLREALSYLDMEMGSDLFEGMADQVIEAASHLKVLPYAGPALRILKGMGYELALVSNGTIDLVNLENRLVDQIFDYHLAAEEARCYMPELRFFEFAVDKFDLYTKDSTFVTTHYWKGIVPANRAGWRKVWLHNNGKKGRKKEEPYGEVSSLKDLPLYFS
jgi:2-haloacid dehalogenase